MNRTMDQVVQTLVRRIIEGYHPQKIVLFGSLVWGEPDEDSDIDLLIIKETDETPLERRVHVRRLVSDVKRRIPFSPIVLTPEELDYRLKIGDPFYQEIILRGLVLYESN